MKINFKKHKILFSLITMLFSLFNMNSQNSVTLKIDSLNSLKIDLQTKIQSLNSEIDNTKDSIKILDQQISEIRVKSSNLTRPDYKIGIIKYNEVPAYLQPKYGPKLKELKKGDTVIIQNYYQDGIKYTYLVSEMENAKVYIRENTIDISGTNILEYRTQIDEWRNLLEQQVKIEKNELAEIKTQREQILKDQQKKRSTELSLQRKIQRKKDLTQIYGEDVAEDLLNNLIWIGMSTEMAKISRGNPKDINRSVGSWGVHEQWVYYRSNLYFENGKLTSWQD